MAADEAATDAQDRDGESAETATDTRDGAGDLPEGVKNTLAAARKAEREAVRRAAEAEARVREYEDRDKSETQKLNERAEAAEKAAQDAQTNFLRLKVGQTKGLPVEFAELLHGADEQEMAAHADRLLAAGAQPTTGFDGGVHQQEPATGDMNAVIRHAAGRRS